MSNDVVTGTGIIEPSTTEDRPIVETYDSNYYASHCGGLSYSRDEPHWAKFFGRIANEIMQRLQPQRVFDAGCAHGFLLEALWERGIEIGGRDISNFAISQVRRDLRHFVAQGSITDKIEGEYDLITCIEVLEHIEEDEAVKAIASMAAAAPRILFSSSPDDFEEPTHINVKPPIWWLRQFAEAGFAPVTDFDASFLTPHAYLLQRSCEGKSPRELRTFAELLRQRLSATEYRARLEKAEVNLARAVAETEQARNRAEMLRQKEMAALAVSAAAIAERARIEASLGASIEGVRAERDGLKAERDAILYSTTWRATRAVRRLAGWLPASRRQTLRRILRGTFWIVTGQFGRRMAERRAFRAAAILANPVERAIEATSESDYERWIRECGTLTKDDRKSISEHIARLSYLPLISVVMPAYETPETLLRDAIRSVLEQLYPHWELCIADDASHSETVRNVLQEFAMADSRIKWVRRTENGQISAATNSALSLATGDFVALLDHDDLLADEALYEIAVELNAHPEADLIFTDEDHIDELGQRSSPYFKPDWNIELMLGHNLVSHLGVYRRALLQRLGCLRSGAFDGSQDYDLALRCAAVIDHSHIRHIPAILYHWRQRTAAASFSQAQSDRCFAAARLAISDYLKTVGFEGAEVVPAPDAPFCSRTRWPLPNPPPRVSIIIPTRDQAELLTRCTAGVLDRTDYPYVEVLIVNNDSTDNETLSLLKHLDADHRVHILDFPGAFNYSAINNMAVDRATGEIVVLMNNDVDVIDAGWLREMVSLAIRPDIGAVGAKLRYADGTIQHAGVVLGVGTHAAGPGVAGHFGHHAGGSELGYFGQFALTREVSAVTAACLAMRRELYIALGGLDAEHLPISFNDVDLCLRLRETGLRIVWTPFAELYHLESISRGHDDTAEKIERAARESEYMRRRWGKILDSDPFYNPNFDRLDHTFRLAVPRRREKPWLKATR